MKGSSMKALQQMVDAIYELGFSEETLRFFAKARPFIIEAWSHSEATNKILKQLNFQRHEFIEQIAEPVYEYFSSIIRQHNLTGDCPTMRELVNKFFTMGLRAEEVFINCTTFKNAIIRVFDERSPVDLFDDKHKLLIIMDYNLYRVLSIYSDILELIDKELIERKKIIDENVAMSRTDLNGMIIEVSDAFCKMSGYSQAELLGQTHKILKHPDVDDSIYDDMWANISTNQIWMGEIPNLRKDGSTFINSIKIVPVADKNGQIIEYLAIRHDITADHLAFHDVLTGLYNRRAFETKYLILFEKANLNKEPISIIMVDIDHFKSINDDFGHLFGDEILKEVGIEIVKNTRSRDLCTRWGGEEFVIVLPATVIDQALEIAERIRSCIESEIKTPKDAITCSFGVVQKEGDESAKMLLKRVDDKLYRAKQNGRNRCER